MGAAIATGRQGGVTAMGNRLCDVCRQPLGIEAAYLAQGSRWTRRRWQPARLLICPPCWNEGRASWNVDHRALPVSCQGLLGRGVAELPPTPCACCGQLVIRATDPLLKRVTCSVSCSASLSRSRNARGRPTRPCSICGIPITTGRADTRHCSPACRQKAYRARRGAG